MKSQMMVAAFAGMASATFPISVPCSDAAALLNHLPTGVGNILAVASGPAVPMMPPHPLPPPPAKSGAPAPPMAPPVAPPAAPSGPAPVAPVAPVLPVVPAPSAGSAPPPVAPIAGYDDCPCRQQPPPPPPATPTATVAAYVVSNSTSNYTSPSQTYSPAQQSSNAAVQHGPVVAGVFGLTALLAFL